MNPEAQELFDSIIIKEVDALTPQDIDFLKARKSYLSAEKLDEYDSVLNPSKAEVKEKEEVKKSEQKESAKEEKRDEKRTQKLAKELGIDIEGKSHDELLVAIDTIKGPANAGQPE